MAQTSGFFEAEWDAELYNEETQTYGDWDRKYLAEQFARYFSKFVSTGVMNDVPNQLKVSAGTGMNVIVSPGFAFINGFWYYNSEQLVLAVPLNETPSTRIDSVRVRWNAGTRSIDCIYVAGDITNVRSDLYYDLQVAQVSVEASASILTDEDITDTRANDLLCGLINLIKAEDVGDLSSLETSVKSSLVGAINSFSWNVLKNKPFVQLDANTLVARDNFLVVTHAEDDIVIAHQTFTFTNKQCTIFNNKITADSLADVFFDASSIAYAQQADISVETYDGYLTLTAETSPSGTIAGTIRVRVV